LKFTASIGGDGTRSVDGLVGAFEDLARFGQKYAAGIGQADGFGGAFEEKKAEFVFEVAHLAAQGRLRDVQFERGARNVFRFSDRNEITEVAEFHPEGSIAFSYTDARNMVFPESRGAVAMYCHDENTTSE
jgi:hypothetical protein